MTTRTYGATRTCAGCRYWSEMIAHAIDGRGVEALCLNTASLRSSTYTTGRETCEAWSSGHHGAVDDPPDYGEAVRAMYEEEAR